MAQTLFLTRRRLIIFMATFIAASALAVKGISAQTPDSAEKQAGDAKDNDPGEGEKTTEEKNEWKEEGKEKGKKEIVRTDLPKDHRKLSTRKPKKQVVKKQEKAERRKSKRRKMNRVKLKRKKIE